MVRPNPTRRHLPLWWSWGCDGRFRRWRSCPRQSSKQGACEICWGRRGCCRWIGGWVSGLCCFIQWFALDSFVVITYYHSAPKTQNESSPQSMRSCYKNYYLIWHHRHYMQCFDSNVVTIPDKFVDADCCWSEAGHEEHPASRHFIHCHHGQFTWCHK